MDLLQMQKKKIKFMEVYEANTWIKALEKVLSDNSDAYVLYRCHISEHEQPGWLNILFLASDEKGNFKAPVVILNVESGELYFNTDGQKFNFRDEVSVREELLKIIGNFTKSNVPISQIFFDMPGRNAIQRVFVREDPNSPNGEYALFMTSANARADYLYSDAVTDRIIPEVVGADWIKGRG